MAQFDVHRIAGHGLVVDLQNDFLQDLRSRIVAPLREPTEVTVSTSRLTPLVTLDEGSFRVAVQFLRAVDQTQLGPKVGSLLPHEFELKAALDMLISGF